MSPPLRTNESNREIIDNLMAATRSDRDHHAVTETVESYAKAPQAGGNYKGFVAGVFSGIAKLSVG